MKQPVFVALGDIHLESLIWCKYHHIRGDSFAAFRKFISDAIEWHVPLVLVGDIFNSVEPDPYYVTIFRHEMERCKEEDIPVYALQGNHDKRPTPWYTAAHSWPQHIGDGEPVSIGGISCVGFDYAVRDSIEQSLLKLSKLKRQPQVLFLHQAVRQALGFAGRWNCDLEWVPSGIPLTILGDIHTAWDQQIREGQWAYYTGASHPRNLRELCPKSYLMVYDDLSVDRNPIPSRVIGRFRVTADDQLGEVKSWLSSSEVVSLEGYDLPPVAWVYFTPEYAEAIPRLRSEFEHAIIVSEAIDSPEELDFDLDEESSDGDLISVADLLAKIVDPDGEAQAFSFILQLLEEGQSVMDIIREVREQFYSSSSVAE